MQNHIPMTPSIWGLKKMRRLYQVMLASAGLTIAALSSPASAKCMSLTVSHPDGTSGTILAVAPDSGSADLDAAGYKDASCGTIDKAAYLQKVCNPKSWGNSGVQRQFAIQAGITLAQLCSAARTDAGLPDLTSDEMAQRFLPPNSPASAAAAKDGALPGSTTKGPIAGPLGSVDAATGQIGGQ